MSHAPEQPSTPEPAEPFPWMSTRKPTGPIRLELRTPKQEAFWGVFFVAAGVTFLVATIGRGDVGAIVVGVLCFVMFGGVGVTLLVMARARARWARAVRERRGWSPF